MNWSALLGALVLTFATFARADSVSMELRVKAEFLVRFSAYTEWPARAFSSPSSPFVICYLAADNQATGLERLASRRIKDRPVSLRQIQGALDFEGCHQLYIPRKSGHSLKDILAQAGTAPILIVAETPGAAGEGAHISFFTEGPYLRFDVNLAAAKSAGLTLSPQMLRLARLANP